MEAAALSGITIPSGAFPAGKFANSQLAEKLEEAADWFGGWGERFPREVNFPTGNAPRRVFITLGTEGVYTVTRSRRFFTPVRYVPPLNTSGGGDAFMAGIVYGTLNGWDDEKTVSFSMAMSRITVQSEHTVSREMSLEKALKEMESL
jgi:sugar/nucleoside kinase (ribokinase family)